MEGRGGWWGWKGWRGWRGVVFWEGRLGGASRQGRAEGREQRAEIESRDREQRAEIESREQRGRAGGRKERAETVGPTCPKWKSVRGFLMDGPVCIWECPCVRGAVPRGERPSHPKCAWALANDPAIPEWPGQLERGSAFANGVGHPF
jgi:hypothetical protein